MDNDRTAARGKQPRIGSTQAPPCSGYDDDLAVKADRSLVGMFGHWLGFLDEGARR
jgi:hypothetical protein